MNYKIVITAMVSMGVVVVGVMVIDGYIRRVSPERSASFSSQQKSTFSTPVSLSDQTIQQNILVQLISPIDRALERVTKKPFGINISPHTSPVQPERFSGFHTGVDFETFSDEQNKDVPIVAVCNGSLLLKKYISGYGGVAVEQCMLEDKDITVVYGHLKLSSMSAKQNDHISAGEMIGILGKGFSSETNGERKHLHLGIHNGTAIDIRGYVQSQDELVQWIDIINYLKKR